MENSENIENIESNENLNFQSRLNLEPLRESIDKIKAEMETVIVGQHKMIDQLLVAILANGHVLIEGVPGVAKTMTSKIIAKTLSVGFSRIQFTPDLMPSDILGTSVFDLKKSEFEFKKGPIFSNLILIDEINRAPAKTQAALFEVMEERQITIDGHSFQLDKPFIVLATQNPIEQEGTYRLPEAQLDRFIFKINIDYPKLDEEISIIQREHTLQNTGKLEHIKAVLSASDILGTSVFDLKKSEFEFKKGPIFSNLILIDEINRAPAKTQAALFEVMEERQITIDGNSFQLERPFIVLATQNPIEQEGTYRLPEAQLDRFIFKINIDYPKLDEEISIIQREHNLQNTGKLEHIKAVLSASDIMNYQALVKQIIVEPNLLEYIAKLVVNTRENAFLYLGASPRASIAILNAAKGFAAIRGRDFVTPEDIKEAAIPVLQHRVIVTPEREMEGLTSVEIIKQIIESIEIPR